MSETAARDGEKRDPQTYAITGAAMEVHRVLGPGFLEAVYQEALAVELDEQLIPFKREVALSVTYKWETLACGYRADFVCYDEVLVELKAIERLTEIEMAQVINYLKATGLRRALLLNFAAPSLECKRIVLSDHQSASPVDRMPGMHIPKRNRR